MLSDALSNTGTALSPRASVAMLTLQVRAAVQAADDAEAAEALADDHEAREELRSRLDPLLADRRAELERSLTAAREAAAAKVAAARRAADVMVARASATPPPTVSTPELAVTVVPTWAAEPVIAPTSVIELPSLAPVAAPAVEPQPQPLAPAAAPALSPFVVATEPPPVATTPPLSAAAQPTAPPSAPLAPVNIGIDAEAFARVFAAVFATMLDERLASGVMPTTHLPGLGAPPVPAKKGFWASALHVDVLLLGAAMVIMLIVLAAWLA